MVVYDQRAKQVETRLAIILRTISLEVAQMESIK